jgi:hypothetical protein
MHKRKIQENEIEHGLTNCGTHRITGTPSTEYWYVALKNSNIKKDKDAKNKLNICHIYLLICSIARDIIQLTPVVRQSSQFHVSYFSNKNYWPYLEIV